MAEMTRCRATETFSTVVMWDGLNIPIAWEEGDERDVEPHILELIDRDCPGALKRVRKAPKPKPEPEVEASVTTAAGATDDASTRQVTGAKKPAAKKPAGGKKAAGKKDK